MNLLMWVDEQTALVQTLIGSTIFSLSVVVLRTLGKRAATSGGIFLKEYASLLYARHWIYKTYIHSEDKPTSILGHVFILLRIVQWMLIALLVGAFFVGVHALISKDWIWMICAWVLFNYLLEAYQWTIDTSDDKHVQDIPLEIKEKFLASVQTKSLRDKN